VDRSGSKADVFSGTGKKLRGSPQESEYKGFKKKSKNDNTKLPAI
jgi:hypothetical protein